MTIYEIAFGSLSAASLYALGYVSGRRSVAMVMLRYRILHEMSDGREVTGLPLAERLGVASPHVTSILRGLEDEGIVTVRVEPNVPERGGRARYWYRLKS